MLVTASCAGGIAAPPDSTTEPSTPVSAVSATSAIAAAPPSPAQRPMPLPLPLGALIWQARLDPSGGDMALPPLTSGDPTAASIEPRDGAIDLAMRHAGGSASVGFPQARVAGGFVALLDLQARPPSDILVYWYLRVSGGQNYHLTISTSDGSLRPERREGDRNLPLGDAIPLRGLQAGRTVSLAIAADEPDYTIYADGERVGGFTDDRLNGATSILSVAVTGQSGQASITAARLYASVTAAAGSTPAPAPTAAPTTVGVRPAPPTAAPTAAPLTGGASISGRVRFLLTPVADVPLALWLLPVERCLCNGRRVATTRSASDGTYTFAGLAPGPYRILNGTTEDQRTWWARGDVVTIPPTMPAMTRDYPLFRTLTTVGPTGGVGIGSPVTFSWQPVGFSGVSYQLMLLKDLGGWNVVPLDDDLTRRLGGRRFDLGTAIAVSATSTQLALPPGSYTWYVVAVSSVADPMIPFGSAGGGWGASQTWDRFTVR